MKKFVVTTLLGINALALLLAFGVYTSTNKDITWFILVPICSLGTYLIMLSFDDEF